MPARGRHVDERPRRALVLGDDAQRLLDRVDHLDRANHDAAERVSAIRTQPGVGRGLPGDRGQCSRVQRVPRQRAGQVAAAVQGGVQRRGVLHLRLDDVVAEVGDARTRVQRCARSCRSRWDTRRGSVSASNSWSNSTSGKSNSATDRTVSRASSSARRNFSASGLRSLRCGHRVEAAQPHVDGVDRPPADLFHQPVAGLLQGQAALDELRAVLGEADPVRIAQEVRRVQQEDVQGVTVDPFPAVQQPSQCDQLGVERHAARIFDRIAGADLVGDRADAAYARGDVGRLGIGPSAQECLEEPRRLVDVQLDAVDCAVGQRDMQRAFTFDSGQRADGQSCGSRGSLGRSVRR